MPLCPPHRYLLVSVPPGYVYRCPTCGDRKEGDERLAGQLKAAGNRVLA